MIPNGTWAISNAKNLLVPSGGGSNKSTFGFFGSLAKATLVVDGKPLVEKGKIVV